MEKDLRQLRAQLEGLARLRFADPEHLTEQLQEAADAPASRRLRFASTPHLSRRRALRLFKLSLCQAPRSADWR